MLVYYRKSVTSLVNQNKVKGASIMQINPIGVMNTKSVTSFGKKQDKDCPKCNNNSEDTVKISRPLYNKLLGMAMLAMVAGGPVAVTSCDKQDDPLDEFEMIQEQNTKPKTSNDSTINFPSDIPQAQLTAQQQLAKMAEVLGIEVVGKTDNTITSPDINSGDITEIEYHDVFNKQDVKIKINQDETTKDTLVFDAISKNSSTGQLIYFRHTVTPADSGFIVNTKVTKKAKPPSENTGWNDNGTCKYVPAEGGLKEYEIYPDGTKQYTAKYTFNPSNNAVTKTTPDGGFSSDLTNISMSKLKRIDTGIHEVHM